MHNVMMKCKQHRTQCLLTWSHYALRDRLLFGAQPVPPQRVSCFPHEHPAASLISAKLVPDPCQPHSLQNIFLEVPSAS